mgnify:CR=1 FL=1
MRLDAAPYSKAWYGKTGASPRRREKIRHPPEAVADAEGPVPQSVRFAYATGAIAYGIKDNGFSVFLLLFYNQIIEPFFLNEFGYYLSDLRDTLKFVIKFFVLNIEDNRQASQGLVDHCRHVLL